MTIFELTKAPNIRGYLHYVWRRSKYISMHAFPDRSCSIDGNEILETKMLNEHLNWDSIASHKFNGAIGVF